MVATAAPKPVIVLVPGAWHGPDAFRPMTSILEAAGYSCVGVHLPSVGASTPLDGIEEDVEAIKAVVRAQVESGRDAVVFMHSYGSVPAGEAVKSLARKESGSGSVVRLVYCAAFAPPGGHALIDMLGGKPLPWFQLSTDSKIVTPENPEEVFYSDVAVDLRKSSVAALESFSYRCFFSKTTWEPWRDIPSTYIFCTEDKAIPIQAQRGMIQGTGVKWDEVTIEGASHSPFLSQPGTVADAVRRSVGETI